MAKNYHLHESPPLKGAQLFTDAMSKAGNHIELVAPADAIHTYMFKDANLYEKSLKKMDAFFAELAPRKVD